MTSSETSDPKPSPEEVVTWLESRARDARAWTVDTAPKHLVAVRKREEAKNLEAALDLILSLKARVEAAESFARCETDAVGHYRNVASSYLSRAEAAEASLAERDRTIARYREALQDPTDIMIEAGEEEKILKLRQAGALYAVDIWRAMAAQVLSSEIEVEVFNDS